MIELELTPPAPILVEVTQLGDEVQQALAGKANLAHSHPISSVTGLQQALDQKDTMIDGAMTAHLNALDPHPQYTTAAELAAHATGTGAGGHLPGDGITNAHVSSAAAIAWSKIDKSGATAAQVGAAASNHTHSQDSLTGAWGTRQIKQLTDTTVRSTASATLTSTGLSLSFDAPLRSESSRVKITFMAGVGGAVANKIEFSIARNGTLLHPAGMNGLATIWSATNSRIEQVALHWLDLTPGTNPTYTIHWAFNGSDTVYLGRRHLDTTMLVPSVLLIEEIV
jgi:hypothetical protein